MYLPIGGGTVTGDLTVNGKVTQAGSVGREEWGRVYSASITTIATLITSDGSALPTGGAYRMTAHIPGTGTDQVSMAVFWNENGTWYCNNTFAGGTSSNHIEFLISGSVPKIKTWHSNNYNIQVTHERLFLGETGTDNLRGYFGADSFLKWTESTNALVVPGTIAATGGNSGEWNTAYDWGDHSKAGYTGDQDLTGYLATDGKAADSDLLDGLDLHTGRNNEANKVVRTDANGYIQAGWINTTSGNNNKTAINRIYASQDGYIRYYTPDNFISVLGLVTTTGYNNSNWNTAHGWGNHASAGYLTALPAHNHDSSYIRISEPNESFNPFGGQKLHDGILTNRMAGKWDRFVVTIDGTVEAGASKKLSNQNFEEYNQNRLFGTSAGETKVYNINLQYLQSGNKNNNGITYCAGFFDICFYSSPFPETWSARVKNKDGNWYPVTSLTKVGSAKLRGVMPIGNYATDIEFTLKARTSAPFVTGNITYGISEFEYYGNRIGAAEGGNISALGGYMSGVITTKSGTSNNWNTAYGWGDHASAGYIKDFDITDQTDTKYLRSNADDSFSGGLVSTARDEGIFGTYDSTKTDHVWAMGTGYKNHASGTNFGNLYGIAYKHTNNKTGGTMAGGHQIVFVNNGTAGAAIGMSGNIWTSGVVTASGGNSGEWNAAYDWGDHSKANYLTSYTDTNTQLTDAQIEEMGYIKTYTDTNTQLTDAQVGEMGYIKTDTNTQLNEEDIAKFGFTKNTGTLTSSNDRVYISDTRGAARAPSYYNDRYAQWDFQNNADTGVGGDGWHALLTVSKWSSWHSSHRQEQLIFSGDHLWRRTATSDTVWGTNKKIWDSGNLTNNSGNWNTAYGWGNHADAGYKTTDNNTTYNFAGSTFTSRNSGNAIAINSATSNMTGYTNGSSDAGYADGGLFVAAYSSSWVSQIFSNFRTGELSTRGKNSGTWQAWRKIHDSGHFSTTDVANGKTAHGWGNHADAGYKTTDNNTQLTTAQVRGKISASGNSQYNATTGVITSTNTNTQRSDEEITAVIDKAGYVTQANVNSSTVDKANGLAEVGYGSDEGTFYQTSGAFSGYSGWANYWIGNHGNGSTYYNTVDIRPFWGVPRYSRLEGGTQRQVWSYWTEENFTPSDYSVKSANETLSGSKTFSNSYNEFGNGHGSVSNDGGWNARVNVAGSSHARLDVKSVSDGIITTMYAHTGHGAGKIGTMSSHPIQFMTGGQTRGQVNAKGVLHMASDIVGFWDFSDRRLKTNIKPLENNLEKVMSLHPVSYQWKSGERKGKTNIGLIAQEVEEIVPEVVRDQERLEDSSTTTYKTVDYEHLVSVLIGAVQEQQEQINNLKLKMCTCHGK